MTPSTETGPGHRLAGLSAGRFPSSAALQRRPCPSAQFTLHHANVPHHWQMAGQARAEHQVHCQRCETNLTRTGTDFSCHLFFSPHVLPHLNPFSSPVHTYMVLNLLHTLIPALDSRFSETANNLSLALGEAGGVSERRQSRLYLFLHNADTCELIW